MADIRQQVPENVSGDYFVDTTCIDCDTCRQIAPGVFGEIGEPVGQDQGVQRTSAVCRRCGLPMRVGVLVLG